MSPARPGSSLLAGLAQTIGSMASCPRALTSVGEQYPWHRFRKVNPYDPWW